jgi:hypothetical protein
MIMRCWLIASLAALSAPSWAAGSLKIEDIAGVYRSRHTVEMTYEPGKPVVEDVLEIVKTAPGEAYIRLDMMSSAGDYCHLQIIAKAENRSLVYRKTVDNFWSGGPAKVPCVLTLTPVHGELIFSDREYVCSQSSDVGACGIKADLDGEGFEIRRRRPIRYMKRLLASREYRDAVTQNAP